MELPSPPLLLITDRTLVRKPLLEVVEDAFEGGCRWLMIREKDLDSGPLTDLAKPIARLGERFGATILVNGNAGVAASFGLGVHLPQGHSVAEARRLVRVGHLVGVSAHSLEEASRAAEDGADYVTLSPIFPTISKKLRGKPLGVRELGRVASKLPIPVVALGGIKPDNTATCFEAGAAGVAVLGSVMGSPEPLVVVRAYLDEVAASGGFASQSG